MAAPKKLFAALELPLLTRLLSDAGLRFVDIGGRGGAFLPITALARFADYVAFEPDPEEAVRLRDDLSRPDRWRTATVVPAAVGARTGTATLHVTRNPGMSSLLEPDPDIAARFWLAGKFKVVSTAQVPVAPLDDLARQYGFEDATFIKLDTQGTELDILRSGPNLVRSVVAIHAEAWFHPFYKHQPLFADLDSYLRGEGFTLFALNRTMLRRAGHRSEMYSRHVAAWAHCLYLREPDTLTDPQPGAMRKRLLGLLAICIGFHHYDLAIEIGRRLEGAGMLGAAEAQQLGGEIERAAAHGLEQVKAQAEKGLAHGIMDKAVRDKTHLE